MNDVKITPKWIPIKCPNCNGYGSVSYGKKVCHVCKGLGYLKVPPKDDDDEKQNE